MDHIRFSKAFGLPIRYVPHVLYICFAARPLRMCICTWIYNVFSIGPRCRASRCTCLLNPQHLLWCWHSTGAGFPIPSPIFSMRKERLREKGKRTCSKFRTNGRAHMVKPCETMTRHNGHAVFPSAVSMSMGLSTGS